MVARRLAALGLGLPLVSAGACSSPDSAAPTACATSVQQPLVNGAALEHYLGLSDGEIAAIVEVSDSSRADGALCSGTFVAPAWVVTAAHCLQIPSPAVVVQGASPASLPVLESIAHPTADVALLHVDVSAVDAGDADGGVPGMVPMRAGGSAIARLAAGDVVEMAGYGVTEARTFGSLRFLAESILGVDDAEIRVSGFGASGACLGDSGGPLLVRDADGAPRVGGVLSAGSATCNEDDTYVRLDAIEDWIDAAIGSVPAPPRPCGGIDAQGRCLFGSAVWCDGTELTAQACGGATRCGWDRTSAAFRCVNPAADPCGGVDAVGACVAGDGLSCTAGVLRRQTCAPCNVCRVDGRSGSPQCLASSSGE